MRSVRIREISMSIEKNIQTVKGLFAAISRGDKEALLELVVEDIEWIIPGEDWPSFRVSRIDASVLPGRSCDEAHEIGAQLLDAVDARMRRLAVVREELHRIVASCTTRGRAACCRILDALADHHHDGCATQSDTSAIG